MSDDPHPIRILIGENNLDIATTLTMLLDAEPDMHCVGAVRTSQELLRIAEQETPNAFVLDLSLDDGSSMPLITTLRSRWTQAAIVVFTGHNNSLITDRCLNAGANSVVVKGGEFEELTTALRRALGMKKPP
jgi:DNA-binding NarL/FixJ family response regulator